MRNSHKVVVIGGGFGGLYAVKELQKTGAEIVLLDRSNVHLFQPLLYQLATGALSSGDIAAPLRAVFSGKRNVEVVLGEAIDFDLGRRKVITTDSEIGYDTLIVAAGSETNYFGHDEWREHALGLKSMDEAVEIRRRVFFAFEEAEKESVPERRKEWLTFAIVGAGPTGVEVAGALAEISRDTLRHDFRCIDPAEAQIILIDGLDRVLPTFPAELSAAAERDLAKLGVRFRPKTMVKQVGNGQLVIQAQGGAQEELRAHTVIWAAGVKANPLARTLAHRAGVMPTRGGQVPAEPDCTLPGHPEVFVIGDLAALTNPQTGKPLPGLAAVAMQQGKYVAQAISARREGRSIGPFQYNDRGNLATIGRNRAVADLGRVRFDGFPAWTLWLFVHLMYLVQFSTRALVLLQWGIQYFTRNRGSRIVNRPEELIAEARANRARELPREPRVAAD